MGVATAEQPPEGLDAYWLGVWRHALKTLQAQGLWAWEQKPLLDEYVFALRGSSDARVGFGWLDRLGAVAEEEIQWVMLGKIAGALPAQWDKHAKRASGLADQLALTPRGRKAAQVSVREPEKPAGSIADELLARRQSRSA